MLVHELKFMERVNSCRLDIPVGCKPELALTKKYKFSLATWIKCTTFIVSSLQLKK